MLYLIFINCIYVIALAHVDVVSHSRSCFFANKIIIISDRCVLCCIDYVLTTHLEIHQSTVTRLVTNIEAR